MAEVTTTTAAKLIPELWYEATAGYKKRVLRLGAIAVNYTSYIQAAIAVTGGGSKLNIPLVLEEDADTLASGGQLQHAASTDEEAEITFTHYYKSKRVGDLVKLQAVPSMVDQYSQMMGYSLGKAEESVIATAIQADTPTELTNDNTVTEDESLTAVVAAADAGIDLEEDMPGAFLFCSPLAYSSILKDDALSLYTTTGVQSPVYSGMMGRLYGAQVYVSTDWSDATDADTVTASWFTGNAIGYGYQLPPTFEAARDINYLADVLVHHAIIGAVALKSTNASPGWIYNWDNP